MGHLMINDIFPWNYSQIPDIIGGHGKGFVIEIEGQLEESLSVVEKLNSQVMYARCTFRRA
jgi:hypothetical protein